MPCGLSVGTTGEPGARSYIVEVVLDHLSAEGQHPPRIYSGGRDKSMEWQCPQATRPDLTGLLSSRPHSLQKPNPVPP